MRTNRTNLVGLGAWLLFACGGASTEHSVSHPEPAPGTTPDVTAAPAPAGDPNVAWIGRMQAGLRRDSDWVVPDSFYREDRRYAALLPERGMISIEESWGRALPRLAHQYDVIIDSDAEIPRMQQVLTGLGRTTEETGPNISAMGDPRVIITRMHAVPTLRIVVVFPESAGQSELEAFTEALPEIPDLRQALRMGEPDAASFTALAAGTWKAVSQWVIEDEELSQVASALPGLGFTSRGANEDDEQIWTRDRGTRRVQVQLGPAGLSIEATPIATP